MYEKECDLLYQLFESDADFKKIDIIFSSAKGTVVHDLKDHTDKPINSTDLVMNHSHSFEIESQEIRDLMNEEDSSILDVINKYKSDDTNIGRKGYSFMEPEHPDDSVQFESTHRKHSQSSIEPAIPKVMNDLVSFSDMRHTAMIHSSSMATDDIPTSVVGLMVKKTSKMNATERSKKATDQDDTEIVESELVDVDAGETIEKEPLETTPEQREEKPVPEQKLIPQKPETVLKQETTITKSKEKSIDKNILSPKVLSALESTKTQEKTIEQSPTVSKLPLKVEDKQSPAINIKQEVPKSNEEAIIKPADKPRAASVAKEIAKLSKRKFKGKYIDRKKREKTVHISFKNNVSIYSDLTYNI